MSAAGLLLLKVRLWILVGAIVATGCPLVLAASERPKDVQTELQQADPAMKTEPSPDSGMKVLVATAVGDLAGRLSIDPSAIEVVSVEEVTWPDPSLGCPQPGMKYRQIPVDGYRIRLRAAGRFFAYHGGDLRGPFLCRFPAGHRADEDDAGVWK